MPTAEVSGGVIDYEDTGGSGPALVFLHGFLMSGSLWDPVTAQLRDGFRCISPTLLLGSHRRPARPDADLSLRGQVRMVRELLDVLALPDVTLVGIDTGGAIAQMLVAESPDTVARLVLVSSEAFDNYPPGLPGNVAWAAAQVPGGIYGAIQSLRVPSLRRLPLTFGWMSKRPMPNHVVEAWLEPSQTNREIRRDVRRYAGAARRERPHLIAASERMHAFDRPALVVWSPEDRVFPIEDGRRLANLLPQGRLVEIDDSYALIPYDQPAALAGCVREFAA